MSCLYGSLSSLTTATFFFETTLNYNGRLANILLLILNKYVTELIVQTKAFNLCVKTIEMSGYIELYIVA